MSKTPPQPESSTARLLRPFRAYDMFGTVSRGGAPGYHIPGLQPSGNKAPSASAPHRPRQHHIIRIADPHTAPPSIPRPHRPHRPRIPPLLPSALRVFASSREQNTPTTRIIDHQNVTPLQGLCYVWYHFQGRCPGLSHSGPSALRKQSPQRIRTTPAAPTSYHPHCRSPHRTTVDPQTTPAQNPPLIPLPPSCLRVFV